ncbi:hypothetical protein ABFS83_08G092700 [Erythranthe nasuta]
MSGQKNRSIKIGDNVEDLLTFTWKNWREGTTENMIDPVLRAAGTGSLQDMIKCIHMGLLCVQENAAKRPTMASILVMLSSSTVIIPVPSEPAFFMASIFGQDTSLSHNYDDSNSSDAGKGFKTGTTISEGLSINDVTSTDLYPRYFFTWKLISDLYIEFLSRAIKSDKAYQWDLYKEAECIRYVS